MPLWVLLDRDPPSQPAHTAERVTAAGIQWRVLRAGAGDTTLVLVHGYGEHLLGWRAVIDRLARDHKVIALDLPGFGVTDKPDTVYSLDQMASWLRVLLDQETSGPIVLVGHSMGGAIVSAAALANPDRIEHLVLIAPAGLNPGLGRIGSMMGPAGQQAVGWWETARSLITPVHDPEWLAEPAEMASYDPMLDSGYRLATARILNDFAFDGIGERFRELSLPVLVIWGRYDAVIPFSTGDSIVQLLPCGRLAPLDAMHRPQMERPDTTAALILGFRPTSVCH